MGFIKDQLNNDYMGLFKRSGNACTYPDFFVYWRENLFERLMRLFIWECGNNKIMPKEIEQRLIAAGHCGITQYEGQLTAFFGSFFGVTVYNDEWLSYNVHSPIYSGTYTINEDIAIINANSLRNPTLEHVNHYASLLAHAEVTLMMQMIEARDSGGVPIAKNEKAKQSLLDYQGKRYKGKIGVVSDLAGIGVEYLGSDKHTKLELNDIWDVRSKLLKSFYADIGVRATFDKKSNAVVDEVTSDTSMLLYNVSDMLEERKRGCDAVNNLFGADWSVRLSDEIDYSTENQPFYKEETQPEEMQPEETRPEASGKEDENYDIE